MKIVYCIYGTFNSGGMERVLSIKANYLVDKLGYDIHIVTTNQKDQSSFFQFSPLIKMHDLNVNYAGENQNSISKKILPFLFKLKEHKRKLKKLLFEIKPDITISMFGNDMFFLNDINDGSKKIIEAHFSRFHRLQLGRKGIFKLADIFRDKLNVNLCKKFDKFVVLTEEDKTYWKGFDNIEVIPNPCSFETNSCRADLKKKQVLAVGRYTYQKGFDLLIDIWEIVNKKKPDWTLKIIGNGVLHQELTEKIKEKRLEEVIVLKPAESEQIAKEYLSSSIYALSSRYEGFPMVLLEAAVCGLPIVAFECKCGPKDIIENGTNGFLIQEGDINAFANAIMELINNEDTRRKMGDNIYLTSNSFGVGSIMKKWQRLFEQGLIN